VASGARGQAGDETNVSLSSASFAFGMLPAGELVATRQFMIDSASQATFVVLSPALLNVDIKLPSGQSVGAGTPLPPDVDVQAFSLDEPMSLPIPGFGLGAHVVITFHQPAAGTYELRVTTATAFSEATPFAVTLNLASDVRFAVSLPQPEVTVGNMVAIAALLFEGANAVSGAAVSASIAREPDDALGSVPAVSEVELRDDGQPPDDAAGDGIYTGVFEPDEEGTFLVSAQAVGTSSIGRPFERKAGTRLRVTEPTSTLLDQYTSFGVDDNDNGLFDRLRIGTAVDIGTAGRFDLSLRLRSDGGRTIAGNVVVDITPGQHFVFVDFPAADVRALAGDGPYAITAVRLDELTATERSLRDSRIEGGSTDAIALADFERGPILLTGDVSTEGIDTNANGLFDILKVRIGVDVLQGGFDEWSARLVDPHDAEIGFAAGSGALPFGTGEIELDFDGCMIGSNGADGPYVVRDLLLFGASGSLVDTSAIAQAEFSVRQFECVPVCGDGSTGGQELCDDSNTIDGDGCDSNCRPTGCGNGIATTGEQCDDGNAIDGDGCEADCRVSATATSTASPTESPSPTASATETMSATATPPPIATDTATATTAPSSTTTATVTASRTATATATATATPTSTPSRTPSATATGTSTPVATATASISATATPTFAASRTSSATASATGTRTPAATATTTSTATPTVLMCTGDCDGSGDVVVSELIRGVNIALGLRPTDDCRAMDADGDGNVTISELIAAVRATLDGC
jgi:cysteine-rich repeat protein